MYSNVCRIVSTPPLRDLGGGRLAITAHPSGTESIDRVLKRIGILYRTSVWIKKISDVIADIRSIKPRVRRRSRKAQKAPCTKPPTKSSKPRRAKRSELFRMRRLSVLERKKDSVLAKETQRKRLRLMAKYRIFLRGWISHQEEYGDSDEPPPTLKAYQARSEVVWRFHNPSKVPEPVFMWQPSSVMGYCEIHGEARVRSVAKGEKGYGTCDSCFNEKKEHEKWVTRKAKKDHEAARCRCTYMVTPWCPVHSPPSRPETPITRDFIPHGDYWTNFDFMD